MRPTILAFSAAALLLIVSAAQAAPTCQDKVGDTLKCGTPGAMPVGWTLPPAQRWERDRAQPAGPRGITLLSMLAVIGGLFGLIAAMPEFDGTREGDWDRQEGDEEERR